MDLSYASASERAIVMLIERMDAIEEHVFETQKLTLITGITSTTGCEDIAFDIYAFLMGCTAEQRKQVPSCCMYMVGLLEDLAKTHPQSDRLKTLVAIHGPPKAPWELRIDQDIDINEKHPVLSKFRIQGFGHGILTMMRSLKLSELQAYHDYRCKWTGWLKIT